MPAARFLGFKVVERVAGPSPRVTRGTATCSDLTRVLGYQCRNRRCPQGRWHLTVTDAARCGGGGKG
jgi:hypothetical protein